MFQEKMSEILKAVPEAKCINGERADMFQLHTWIKQQGVDLLIGNTYGKYIARDEDLPFVRFGFPILDRSNFNIFPHVGYTGAMNLVSKMLDAVFDHYDRTCPEEKFELQM
jgi:nitrogenase molybdenum-iron protein beta chain